MKTFFNILYFYTVFQEERTFSDVRATGGHSKATSARNNEEVGKNYVKSMSHIEVMMENSKL